MKNIKQKWLIEESVFSEDISNIIAEIKNQDMEVKTLKYIPFKDEEYDQYSNDDCVIVLGSINLIKKIQKTKPWIPGSFANFSNFDCMTYYAYFSEYLLNRDNYYIMPLNEVKRHLNKLQLKHGRLFIRPCAGTKIFSGQEIDYTSITKHQDQYGKPETPVVVSGFNSGLTNEFRIFCSGNKILGGSMYYDCRGDYKLKNLQLKFNQINKISKEEERNIIAVNFAQKILDETSWRPDKIFVMDIGIIDSDHDRSVSTPYLIEINSFSCSGWYATDPENIIKETAKIALEEWKDINNASS